MPAMNIPEDHPLSLKAFQKHIYDRYHATDAARGPATPATPVDYISAAINSSKAHGKSPVSNSVCQFSVTVCDRGSPALAKCVKIAYIPLREVGAGRRLANLVRTGR